MGKLSIFVILVFLAALGLFAVENTGSINIKMPFGNEYEMAKIALILLSLVVGAMLVLFYFFVRDTKRVIDAMQLQKKQKKEARIQEYYAKALNAMLGNREEEAREELKAVLKEDPEHADALLRLGDIAFRNEDYTAAIGYYRNARDISPKNIQALLLMDGALEKTGKDDSALKILDEIIDMDSDNLTALYRKQGILEKAGRWDELLSLQKNIVKLVNKEKERQREEKKLLGFNYEYGRASLESGDIEKAEKAFRTLVKTDATFLPAYVALAEVMVAQRDNEEAINFLEKSYETLRSNVILARLEDLLIAEGEPGRLLRIYQNAISKAPRDKGLKFMLGKLYARLEMVDDAIETLEAIDSGMYSNPDLHVVKAELYRKRNQTNRALDELRKATDIRRSGVIVFKCGACGHSSPDWSGRCPDCLTWNSLALDV
jgi:tetratricopeptide (TPR) repeat protein